MRFLIAWLLTLSLGSAFAAERGAPVPAVRPERPRIFLRAEAWDGPSLEKIRQWMKLPEYQKRAKKLTKFPRLMNHAANYLITGDEEAGKKAVAGLKKFKITGTNTVRGDGAQQLAALYDWLRDHPDFDEAGRKERIQYMESWGDRFVAHLKKGGETPFYSRLSAVLSGLACLGLALHGDSPKADEYVRTAQAFLVEKFGTIREVEDGASGGGGYAIHWEFKHLARMVAAFRSATDWDAARWIEKNQGDWLRRQMLWQIWMTYPNGWFVKEGDLWGDMTDRDQYRIGLDAVESTYRTGFGRTFADQVAKRWPVWDGWPSDYHAEYVWNFFLFNDPEIKPRPLSDLGRAAVFSPNLHGFVCWRDSWEPDATIIHFMCGDNVDHHGTRDAGKFMVYKRTPLAIKAGAYIGYMTKHHRYYKSVWSSNVVLFTGGAQRLGDQPYVDFDGTPSWKTWKAKRDRHKHPATGVLLKTEANDKFARALGDLSGSLRGGSKWTRELVFLGYKYLLVLDRCKPGADIKTRWTLHSINQPKIDDMTAIIDNGPGRLFCRTLLPKDAALSTVGGPGHECDYNGDNRVPRGKKTPSPSMRVGAWRLDVAPAKPGAETVYLHVLYPTDTGTNAMPGCSVEKKEGKLVVKVGGLTHPFADDEKK